jgi:enterobactin synthetase component D
MIVVMSNQPMAICPDIATWLFPGPVAAHQMQIAMASVDAMTDEGCSVLARATSKRRLEFIAGRACAAASLAALGQNRHSVTIGENRMPLWPDGVVGSISHDSTLACAVAGRSHFWLGLGIDVEMPRRLASSSAAIICREDERCQLGLWPTNIDGLGLVFSAKESIFKCYYPIERSFLDFQDVSLDWTTDAIDRGNFLIRSIAPERGWRYARPISGRWLSTSERLYTSAFLPA